MATAVRDFSGNLDMDSNFYRILPKNYTNALNITRNPRVTAGDGVLANIIGNRPINYTFQSGQVVCIGAFADKLKNRIIAAYWHADSFHTIISIDITTRVGTKIIESKTDSANIDVLKFQLLYKVMDMNIIHRDVSEGDLLLFNDGFNRPGQLNIDDFMAGLYNPVTEDLIRLQRTPPIDELVPVYVSDSANKVNNLKKKLFQFTYAWGYKSGEVSTVAPFSKVMLPVNAYNIDTESNPSQNNAIQLKLTAGGADYKFIRVFGRQSIANGWGDWFIVDTLQKEDYGIPPGGSYTYNFLNDRQYVTADQDFVSLLFDYAADKCNSQTIVNGNVIVQGGVTDGYDKVPRTSINVQLTSAYKLSSSSPGTATPTIGPPVIGVNSGAYYMYFPVGASVGQNTIYKIKFTWAVYSGTDLNVDVTYTASGTDTPATVAAALVALIQAQATGKPFTISVTNTNRVNIQDQQNGSHGYAPGATTYSAIPQSLQSGANAVYKWSRKYRFGIVYVDQYGKSNGVISFVSSDNDPNDFSVTTGDFIFELTSGNPQIPVINASISHIPPSWASAYYWVRVADLTVFIEYITSEVQNDSNYFYFGIEDLNVFRTNNSGFIPSYTFQSGDRIRVLAQVNTSGYDVSNAGDDYEILGVVQRPMKITDGTTTTATNGAFIKVKKPTASRTYGNQMMIEIYTPALQTTSENTQVFYGFGESYPIYTSGVNRYHRGMIQDQNSSQPATFTFEDGDVYYKFRDFYPLKSDGTIDANSPYTRGVMDINYSDYFQSGVNSNGASWVIDPNAKQLFYPNQIRFSEAYEPGTDINGINRFFPVSYEEVIRDYGDIKRMIVWNNALIVFQQFKIGQMPVLQQVWTDLSGTTSVAVSQKLLNRVQYYGGEYGVGNAPESIAWNNTAIYGWDTIRGVIWRISQNGLEAISQKHQMDNFALDESVGRGFNSKIYGVFDSYNNLYISALEATASLTAKTIVWNEKTEGFESFVSYLPEMMCCLNNTVVTWSLGGCYTHDAATYNNFYGVQYDSYINLVFNDHVTMRKTWQAVEEQGNSIWDLPVITTSTNSYGSTKQISNIVSNDFVQREDMYYTDLKRDANTTGAIADGDILKGVFLACQVRKQAASTFSFLNFISLYYTESNLNTR